MACRVNRHLLLTFIIWLSSLMCGSSSDRLFLTKEGINSGLGLRVNMMRRDSLPMNASMTLVERVAGAVERSKARQIQIGNVIGRKDSETPVHVGSGEFLMRVSVGTPPVEFDAIVDTGSDLIWTQCQPCVECYNQPTPIFDPSKSSTYSKVPCNDALCQALDFKLCTPDCEYTYEYGDQSVTEGVLSYETLGIGDSDEVRKIGFGCGNFNQGQGFQQGGGLVGLGRGALSLVSQLGSSVQSKFSYCLMSITDPASKTSPLFFGHSAGLSGGADSMTLIQSSIIPTFYYLPIEGISVGGKLLNIPPGTFDINPDGSGGMIIDSGTTVTFLDDAAYSPLKEAFQSAIQLPPADGSSTGLDLCYKSPSDAHSINLPALTFHFKGGIDFKLPTDNYFIQLDNGMLCLAVLGSSGGIAAGPSIFGNIQQQNFHILYDNANNLLSFIHTNCDSL